MRTMITLVTLEEMVNAVMNLGVDEIDIKRGGDPEMISVTLRRVITTGVTVKETYGEATDALGAMANAIARASSSNNWATIDIFRG